MLWCAYAHNKNAVVRMQSDVPELWQLWCACVVTSHSCDGCVCIGSRFDFHEIEHGNCPYTSFSKLRPNFCTELRYECNGCFGRGPRKLGKFRKLRACGRFGSALARVSATVAQQQLSSHVDSKHELPLEAWHLNCAPARVSDTL